ncbi:MAG TPA: enoyl-[acyl-carrier-protein] reductase FabK [Chloroflexi bacterium]|jgi:enoyl-[acyl-carrier protein] reductase II|nr:enoyl-[acyl-carrier-protein] reductase FabK [Chloroflexota bacterium]
MLKTALTELLGIDYPIIQGGMAWVATAELVVAVSEGGALGILGAGNAPVDWVKDQLTRIKENTSKPYGVNIPLFSPFADQVVELCIQEKVPVLTTGAGNPTPYIKPLKEAGIIVIPVVASAALARRLENAGADAVIAEGLESGGHIGSVSTLALLPQVVDAVRIPVIAAGGVGDGRGLVAALSLGAAGVQMGTRFVCTDECIAHANYKEAIIKANERSTLVTGLSIGHPVRCLRNPMSRDFEELERRGASDQEIIEFGTGRLRMAVMDGDVVHGSVMAGQIAGLIRDVAPAAEVIRRIGAEAEEIIGGLGAFVAG